MRTKDNTIIVGVRIPEGLIRFMDQDIGENRDLRSRSEYIIVALREYEERRTELITEREKIFFKDGADRPYPESQTNSRI